MADIQPLRGIRYDRARTGDLGTVVAPPYDVVSPDVLGRLYDRSPYNSIRLILNREADSHAAAARAWTTWRTDGVLVQDAVPGFYFYSQRFDAPRHGSRRRDGLLVAMRLEELGRGVFPHERTMEGPKADRLRLIRACKANLSPIFGLVSCPGRSLRDLVAPAVDQPPAVSVTDDLGVRNDLWPVTDPDSIARSIQVLGPESVVIADGHHRYETALAYRNEMRRAHPDAGPSAPFESILMYLSNIDEPGLVVLPTHRVLRDVRSADVAQVVEDLADVFQVAEYEVGQRDAFLAALFDGATRIARIGCALPDKLLVLSLRHDPATLLPERTAETRGHAVVILHDLVLPRLLPTPLQFTHDDGEAMRAVAGGDAGAAFLLPAPTAQDVRAVCLSGETMPEKSTYFYPKLLTGLVFRTLEG